MSILTEERIKEIKERCEKATPGPYEWWSGNPWHANAPNHPLRRPGENPPRILDTGLNGSGFFYREGAREYAKNDCLFFMNARIDLPDALETIDSLRQQLQNANKLIEMYRDKETLQK